VEEVAAAGGVEGDVDEAAMMDRGDNFDDKEGYYAHRLGDLLNDRYKIVGMLGKGVFATVVRCFDTKAAEGQPSELAIKVQRNNDMMRRAGEKEISYLRRIAENDPENKRHCIQFLGSFDHEDHLCMVFEALHQNLRGAIKQHGYKKGIQIDAVRIYGRQLFVALRYLERLNIMHADLKPDNILVNDKYNLLKVCDFGSASNGDDNEITPYLVSRFYRAPEIMMGLHYGCPIDMWAAGVTLFELYTGKIEFMGSSNNQMLKLIQEVKGKMPHKLIRKGVFSELHFDPDYDFLYKERDKVSGREVIRTIKFEQRAYPGKELKTTLMPSKVPDVEARKVLQLADFLEKCLMLDPSKRLNPSQALKHPFCDTGARK
jgi:serine/threonine-protein kinase PRP4